MSDQFLVGCGSGFSGDRIDAPIKVCDALVLDGRPSALVLETLAERTIALGHLRRERDPESGYEPRLADLIRPILRSCVENHIPIIGNFGAAHPRAAARLLHNLALDEGLPDVRIAVVYGDDIKQFVDIASLTVIEQDSALIQDPAEVIAINAYLGARPIVEALSIGADFVVTGRVADAALALAPLVAHFGWSWDDWDLLAAGTLVGHLLECGGQVTGGYFADPGYKDVPHLDDLGFPVAEVTSNGDAIICKPAGTGGIVDAGAVKEQLLYEIDDPSAYLTPDVTLDITEVDIREVGPNRVLVTGAKGSPPPRDLKAIVSYAGGWVGEAEISYAGPNALARARLAGEVLGKRLHSRKLDVRRRIDFIGLYSVSDSDDGALLNQTATMARPNEVRLRLAVASKHKADVESSVQEVLALYTCGPAGGGGVRTRVEKRIKTASYLVPRELVIPTVGYLGEFVE